MSPFEEARAHRVATYNVHSCVGLDRRCRPERIAEVILELNADTVALQEVDTRPHGGEALSQLELLAEQTGMIPTAGPTLRSSHGPFGNAVLTRKAPHSVERHDLSIGGYEPRGALALELEPGGLRVIATHLGLAGRERHEQIDALIALLHRMGAGPLMAEAKAPVAPILFLGDLNEWHPFSRLSRRLRTLGMTPHPRSFPAGLPVFALDRICTLPSDLLLRAPHAHASRLSRVASDHLPVVAELRGLF